MHTSKKSILLVDDDPGLLHLLTVRLSSAGYHVIAASSAEKALELLMAPPHLILTDFLLPGMDGVTLCEVVQQRHPGVPAVILTAYGAMAQTRVARQRGVAHILAKPFQSKDLLTYIAKVIQQTDAGGAAEGQAAV